MAGASRAGSAQPDGWPYGAGEMAGRVRAFDWSTTPLGPIERWPAPLRTAVDIVLGSPLPMSVLWGPEFIQLYNDGCLGLMGDKHPAGLGQPTRDCWPEVWHINEPLYQRVRQGESIAFENAHYPLARSGKLEDAWFTIAYSPIHDAGEVAGIFVTVLDETERVRAATAHGESEERFRVVANLVPDFLWRSAPDGRTEWYSQRWYDYTGQTPEEALGYGWVATIHPDDREVALAEHADALASGSMLRAERRIRGSDGSYRWFLLQSAAIRDERGTTIGRVGSATDVHEQRVARDDLEARITAATASLRALSRQLLDVQEMERRRFARELHDEVGQSLTGLNLTLELARRERASEHLARAAAISQNLLEQVRQLSLDLRPPVLDDLGLAPALTALVEGLAARTGLQIELGYQGLNRRFPEDVETTAYRVIQEALTNIVRHAATENASVQLLVDRMITIWISDAGDGFDVDAALQSDGSSGLRGMVERVRLARGTIRIDSAPGEGTTIVAELPVAADVDLSQEELP